MEPLPSGLAGRKLAARKIMATAKRFLSCIFVRRIAIKIVSAVSASTPPNETIGNAGESTWLNATRVQPKPPNGTRDRSSSIRRRVNALHQRLRVLK